MKTRCYIYHPENLKAMFSAEWLTLIMKKNFPGLNNFTIAGCTFLVTAFLTASAINNHLHNFKKSYLYFHEIRVIIFKYAIDTKIGKG